MALAAVFVEGPPDDDARLALSGQAVDSRRDPGRAPARRGPRHGGRRHRGSRSPPRRSRAEPPCAIHVAATRPSSGPARGPAWISRPSSVRTAATDEALVEHRGAPSSSRRARLPRPRRRSAARVVPTAGSARRASATRASPSRSSTRSPSRVTVKRALERRRETQRHLDTRLAQPAAQTERLGEQAGRVAAVGRGAGAAEPAGDRERCEHRGRVQFMPCSRKQGGRA